MYLLVQHMAEILYNVDVHEQVQNLYYRFEDWYVSFPTSSY